MSASSSCMPCWQFSDADPLNIDNCMHAWKQWQKNFDFHLISAKKRIGKFIKSRQLSTRRHTFLVFNMQAFDKLVSVYLFSGWCKKLSECADNRPIIRRSALWRFPAKLNNTGKESDGEAFLFISNIQYIRFDCELNGHIFHEYYLSISVMYTTYLLFPQIYSVLKFWCTDFLDSGWGNNLRWHDHS